MKAVEEFVALEALYRAALETPAEKELAAELVNRWSELEDPDVLREIGNRLGGKWHNQYQHQLVLARYQRTLDLFAESILKPGGGDE